MWDKSSKRYQNFIRETLTPFSRDIEQSTLVPPDSLDSIWVSQLGVGKIWEPTSFINLKPVFQAVRAELPTIGAGVALMTVGNVIPLIGPFLISPFTSPGWILIVYSDARMLPRYSEAKERAFEEEKKQFLSYLEDSLKSIQREFLRRLDSPIQQTLGQVRDQILEEVDAAVDSRLSQSDYCDHRWFFVNPLDSRTL